MVVSNTVGAVVDSILFLSVAGFIVSTSTVAGLVVGKMWVTLAALPFLFLTRRHLKEAS